MINYLHDDKNLIKNSEIFSQLDRGNRETACKVEDFLPISNLNYCKKKPVQWLIKRAFDFAFSVLGLIIVFPILVLLVIIIKLDSNGPTILKQKRIGMNGKEFYMYKFRSMFQDAEERYELLRTYNQTNPVMFKMFDDPRVTKVGRFIRKYSLDELPQLFNVIKGEMSLIGPRPPLPHELEKYKNWHYVRFATLPGLTGMWQVSGRSSVKDFDTVVKLDYKYISQWNLWFDLKIILKTIPVVLSGKNTA